MSLESDYIQFARLLAEISATQDLDVEALASEMDLEVGDVNFILDRAQLRWEEIKSQGEYTFFDKEPPFITRSVKHSLSDLFVKRTDAETGEEWILVWYRTKEATKSPWDKFQEPLPCSRRREINDLLRRFRCCVAM